MTLEFIPESNNSFIASCNNGEVVKGVFDFDIKHDTKDSITIEKILETKFDAYINIEISPEKKHKAILYMYDKEKA